MVDAVPASAQNPPAPQAPSANDEFLRQTEHRAVIQPAPAGVPTGTPEVSYEAEDYQPQAAAQPVTPSAQPTPPPAMNTNADFDQTQSQPAANPVPPAQNPADPTATRFPGVEKPIPEEVIVEWVSKSRPFRKRSRQYYSTGLIIIILVCLILFFAQQILPIAVVIAVGFLAYVLSVVPPGDVKHSITNYGVRIEDMLYYWEELGRFWFTEKFGEKILHIEVGRFPWRITLLLGDIDQEAMKILLSEVLVFQKPAPTTMEKAADWLQSKIPLDDEPHNSAT